MRVMYKSMILHSIGDILVLFNHILKNIASLENMLLNQAKFKIFGLLITLITVLILIYFLYHYNKFKKIPDKQTDNKISKEKNFYKSLYFNLTLEATSICSYIENCVLRCDGGTLQESIDSINNILETTQKCTSKSYLSLTFKSTTFPNKAISSGWLKGVNADIQNLKFESISLNTIGESSFLSDNFGQTSNPLELTFSNTMVNLVKTMFRKSSIKSLEVSLSEMSTTIIIEEDIFEYSPTTLSAIILNSCISKIETVKNLTGKGSILPGVISLDLSRNLLSTIENDMFSKVPNLLQLYLQASGISVIEMGAFQGLNRLLQIHLSGNNIKTLPDGVLNDVTALVSVYISGNPLRCDCDLLWFKEFLDTLSKTESRECRVGSQWLDMDDVDFCPSNSSSSSTSTSTSVITSTSTSVITTTTSTSTSTSSPKTDYIFETISCRNSLMNKDINEQAEKVIWANSIFKKRNIEYFVTEIVSDGTPSFIVQFSPTITSKDYLLWTNIKNVSEYGCIFNISSQALMHLEFEQTYTLCILINDSIDAYALVAEDCTAITTPPDWANRAWLLNKIKIPFILIIIGTIIVAMIISGLVIFMIVKYNPELIKGNKRVLVVKRQSYSPNVLVMPSKGRQVSLCTDHEGYLTPKLKRWINKSEMLNGKMRYQELNTTGNAERNSIQDDDETHLYEPPPIPSNHPLKRRDSGKPYFYSNM